MKTLTLILFLIGTVGIGQGVYNIKTDYTKKDTFEFPTYYNYYAVNYRAITRIPNYAYAIVLGKSDSAEYLWRDRVESVNDGVITNISILKILTNAWTAYKQECWNDSVYKMYYSRISPGNFAVHYPDTLICEYSHRKPTFEGFMQYLERKIKL